MGPRRDVAAVGPELLVMLSVMGGFCNGYSFTIVGGAIARMEKESEISKFQQSLIIMSVLFGGIVGIHFGARWLQTCGRRPATLIGELFVLTFGLLQAFVSNPNVIIVVRLLMGFGTGICVLAKPLLVGELAQTQQRGTLVGMFSWAFSVGITMALVVDSVLPLHAVGIWHWEIAAVPVATSGILITLMVFFIPESPHFKPNAKVVPWMNFVEVGKLGLSDSADGKSLRVLVMLVIGYQGTGMGLIMTLSRQLLDMTGLDAHLVPGFNIAIGVVHFAGACAGVGCISLFTRRQQLLTSLGCTTVACLLTCAAWTLHLFADVGNVLAMARALSLLLEVFAFQCGLAPMFWVISSEIFTLDHRAQLMGITYTLVFLLNLANIGIAPALTTQRSVAIVFFVCHINGIFSFWYLIKRLPETGNKALGNMWAAETAQVKRTAPTAIAGSKQTDEQTRLL